MEHKEYNGWYNYETWLVALWIDNDEPTYNGTCFMAQTVYNSAEADQYFTKEERAQLTLADELKKEYEEADPLGDAANIWEDFIRAGLSEVNWMEIAAHYLENVDKTQPAPAE